MNYLNSIPATPPTEGKSKGKVSGAMQKFRAKGPIKLFSWILNNDKNAQDPTLPLKANTGSNAKQAVPVVKRRGSMDRSNYRQFN
jgi:hypothetical protein